MSKIKKLIILSFCFLVVELAPSLVFVPIAKAQTLVGTTTLSTNTFWSKENSPYILTSYVEVPSGITLNIESGVVVQSSDSNPYAGIYVEGGKLASSGISGDRVRIKNIYEIFLEGSSFDISKTDFENVGNIHINKSNGTIATSSFSGLTKGLQIINSTTTISGSRFKDNSDALIVGELPHLIDASQGSDIGGIGNALEAYRVTVSSSSFVNNQKCAICNYSADEVMASYNWWYSDFGQSSNRISGNVTYEPMLQSEPPFDSEDKVEMCCSSILFLPGLEGIELIKDMKIPIIGKKTPTTLWPPKGNSLTAKLFLNDDGTSIDKNIYSGQPIGSAYGVDIYGGFMSFLDDMVDQGKIKAWKAFAYDWRKPINEVVAGDENKATTTESLVDEVGKLALGSKTGKVTIVAHSNGGLVAKYLVKTLSDSGKADIIDKVISVAVPYLGTPQAIAGLLHGDKQEIGYGILLNQATARQLGLNMSSAYSLLPSAEYFSHILSPSIVFASTSLNGLNKNDYPQKITNSIAQSNFVNDLNNARKNPDISEVSSPAKGNMTLNFAADIIHSVLDPWQWPTNIVRYAIVGWNNKTTKNILYGTVINCDHRKCGEDITYKDETTEMGDGTVLAPSASYNAGSVISADIKKLSLEEGRNIDHANILEASSTKGVIGDIIESQATSTPMALPSPMSWGEPAYSSQTGSIIVSTHSPVELHVYDQKGRHTGFVAKPPEAAEVEDGLLSFYENNIIGADFHKYGDEEPETYITLPDDGTKYRVEIKGTGVGTFDYDIDRETWGGQKIGHAEYDNIPVTPLTSATTEIILPPPSDTSLALASSTAPLYVDYDGDDKVDLIATSSSVTKEENPNLTLEALRKSVIAILGANSIKTKNFEKRFDRLEKLIAKGNLKKLNQWSDKLSNRVEHIKSKKLNENQKQDILNLIDAYLAQYE